jgi:hypothetical protein
MTNIVEVKKAGMEELINTDMLVVPSAPILADFDQKAFAAGWELGYTERTKETYNMKNYELALKKSPDPYAFEFGYDCGAAKCEEESGL